SGRLVRAAAGRKRKMGGGAGPPGRQPSLRSPKCGGRRPTRPVRREPNRGDLQDFVGGCGKSSSYCAPLELAPSIGGRVRMSGVHRNGRPIRRRDSAAALTFGKRAQLTFADGRVGPAAIGNG